MTPLESNIKKIQQATQEIEKQLTENDLPVKQMIVLAKNFREHFAALSLLSEIQAAVQAKSNRIVSAPAGKLVTL